ncbi:sodium channel protein Nach [Nasonia vitripennis]|uniref:Sodium channel protein Nach n=1 Tax=Nasonia vitripennis TaxID=7425 RepID=A0A7M7QKK3_NASVI|nr:sodium channel protein Nach [Nasonia vitripennis]
MSVLERKGEKFWKPFIQQYCENTTLHGFRYVVSRDSTIVEKFIWLLVCILGLSFSVALMMLVWQRFKQTPTVTTIESTTHPIFSLNFPAVSICNYNKVYKPHADKFSEDMRRKGLSEKEIVTFFASLPKLVRPDYIDADNRRALELMTSPEVTIEDIMYDMMQPCEKLLLRCTWEGKVYDCNKIFKPIKSIEGFCCAFNYHVDTSENSIFGVKGAKKYINVSSAVRHNLTKEEPGVFEVLSVPGAGRDVGLSVVLDLEKEAYYGSIKPSVGASILVHDPFNYPEVEILTSFIQPTQEIAVILSGTIMESAPDVRNLDLTRRNCWFNDEKKLQISTVYSYQSCITECRIRYIRRYCNCVPFYYPNYYQERVCTLLDVDCLTKYRGSLSNLRTIIDLVTENNTQDSVKCECLPSCDDNRYTSNSENAFMENVSFHLPILEGFDVKNVSLASIYFRGITCLKYRKESWMSWDDVLASFGGIFGLCVGGSFVSLVEFFYFFANKIFRNSKEQHQQNFVSTPPAREKFKVVSIDRLSDWSRKTKLEVESLQKKELTALKQSYSYSVQSAGVRPDLQEDFIKHFLKQYK